MLSFCSWLAAAVLSCVFLTLEERFHTLEALNTQDGNATVLKCLGKPKPHYPPQPLAVGTHHSEWPQVLNPWNNGEERYQVAWHAQRKHYHSCAERQFREPMFYLFFQWYYFLKFTCRQFTLRAMPPIIIMALLSATTNGALNPLGGFTQSLRGISHWPPSAFATHRSRNPWFLDCCSRFWPLSCQCRLATRRGQRLHSPAG